MLNNTWTQISVTCQLFPIKLLCRLRQLEDDCDSEIAMLFLLHCTSTGGFAKKDSSPYTSVSAALLGLLGTLGAAKRKEKEGRGLCAVFVLCYQSQVHSNGQWSPPLFKSLGEISTCSRVHIVPFIFCPLLFCITTGRGSCTVAAGCNRDYICMLHCLNLCIGSYLRCQ